MKPLNVLRGLATSIANLFDKSASFDDGQAAIAALQRNEFDITKSKDAGASDGLGNVVRVPSNDGTGVSQAPAIATPGTGGVIANKQPRAALQGGEASPPHLGAASSPSTDAGGDVRQRLIGAVQIARALTANHQSVRINTKANYQRKQLLLKNRWKKLQASDATLSIDQMLPVLLGQYASNPSSFYAMRRSIHFSLEEQLIRAVKDQDKLQKAWHKPISPEERSSLLCAMKDAAQQLEDLSKSTDFILNLDLKRCKAAHALVAPNVPPVDGDDFAKTKALVTILNRRLPNWQSAFRAENAQSSSPYRTHALIQSLLGIRPAEFDPSPNPLTDAKEPSQARPGVLVTLLSTGNLKVSIEGAKVGKHSGQKFRSMEVTASAVPPWLVAELQQAGGCMHLTAKTQALRDHYERISARVFKGAKYGKPRRPLHATPYCFRHAVATDLRQTGWEVEELAIFLGQKSADTQKRYGLRKGGRRKAVPSVAVVRGSVQASSPVKSQKSTWAKANFENKPQDRSLNKSSLK